MIKQSANSLTSRRRGWRRTCAAATVAFALVIAACGGDDDAGTDEPDVEESADEPTTDEPTTDEPAVETSAAEPADDGPTTTAVSDASLPGAEREWRSGIEVPSPEPSKGGSATMGLTGMGVAFDPSLHRVSLAFSETAIMSSMFGSLAFMDTETGEVLLYFLEDLSSNDDASVWTLTLHDGLKFSDGTDFNAEAIKFNIERSADPETGSRFEPATEGLELEVIDELTLQVTLPQPNPAWDTVMVSNFAGIGSPTAIQAAVEEGVEVGTRPVGAGPFMLDLESWIPGQSMSLPKNPYFEEWISEFVPDAPYLDELKIENITDTNQIVSALQTNTIQLSSSSGQGQSDDILEVANAVVTETSGGASLHLQDQMPPFDDVRARKALAMAIDRDIVSDAFARGTPPATGLFPETSPYYNPEFTYTEHNPEEAQRLFDELAEEGRPVEFSYTTFDTPAQVAVIDAMLAQLGEYDNVSFEANVVTFPEYAAASTSREYQSLAWGTYFTNPLPILYDNFHSDGILNYSQWSNPTVDAALDSLETAFTVEDQKAVWDVVQEELVKDTPVVWLGKGIISVGYADGFVVPRAINLGTFPLWHEVGYE